MLTNLIFIILQTISMSQFTQERHIGNPIIHPAYYSTLSKQQAYVKPSSAISTLQPISKEGDTEAIAPYNPFIVDEVSERYRAKKKLETERDNLFNSIIVLEIVTEQIRKMHVLDLHIFTRRTGIYNDYIDESPSMGIMLRELHAIDEEYKNAHDKLRKKNIIARLEQIRIALYHHIMGHLNYKRILYAITLSRIYIYKLRRKIEIAEYRETQ